MLTLCLLITLIHLHPFQVSSIQNYAAPQWFAYIEKTNSLCHTHAVSDTLDFPTYFEVFLQCISGHWNQCLVIQKLPMLKGGNYAFGFPCIHGSFLLGTGNLTLNVKVQSSFQIQLTFTKFYLPRGFTGCVTNKVEVSVPI